MEANKKKTIGIIGGMGPMATVDLFSKIVKMTDANRDAEHIHIIIDNRPDIPDRTKALLCGGESPVPMLVESGRMLAASGADFLIIPCNTSHAFYDELTKQIPIPIINMIEATAEHLTELGIRRAGLFATSGTVSTGVYSRIFGERGIDLVLPNDDEQAAVMSLIYDGVKASRTDFDASCVQRIIDNMKERCVDTIVLGCTELPIGVELYSLKGNFADPSLILARAAIKKAGYRCVSEKEEI